MTLKPCCKLILLTAALCACAYCIPFWVNMACAPSVTLLYPEIRVVRDEVPLTGTIAAKQSASLTCNLPYVIKRVHVSVGDRVSAGQIVAEIDKTQTIRTAASLLPLLSAYAEGMDGAELGNMLTQLSDLSSLNDTLPDTLLAPASGTVTACSLKENALVMPGTSPLTVSDCDELCAILSVDESFAALISAGDTVYLKSAATGDRIFSASVEDVSPAAGEVFSGTSLQTVVELTALLSDSTDLRPGYSVEGVFYPDDGTTMLLIPYSAIFQRGTTEYVWVYQAGKAVSRQIEVGNEYADTVEIVNGLHKDELIINNPPELTENQSVIPQDKTEK